MSFLSLPDVVKYSKINKKLYYIGGDRELLDLYKSKSHYRMISTITMDDDLDLLSNGFKIETPNFPELMKIKDAS